MLSADLVAIVFVVVMTVLVVIVVIGLHIWGATQDGREERAMRAWRRPKGVATLFAAHRPRPRVSVSHPFGSSDDSEGRVRWLWTST
jgi:hypothetical protein